MERVGTLLIDRSKLFREGMKMLLADSLFPVTAEAVSLEEGLKLIDGDFRPILVLLDVLDGRDDEAQFILALKERHPDARLVVLADRLSTQLLTWSLALGVDGYLLKDISPEALKQSLSLVLLGEKVFPTDLATLLVNGKVDLQRQLRAGGLIKGLSERELQILKCLLNGYSNKLIANHLNITEGTVKVHLKAVLKKINVRNRTQAAIWALNRGLADGAEAAMRDHGREGI
jgi:two-component system nitrate/nitrite response regulator NarL